MKKLVSFLSFRVLIHLILLRPFLKLFFGINVAGRKNLSSLEHYIIISNHNSHLDTLLLFYTLPVKHILATRPVAAEEYWSKSNAAFKLVNYLFRPIWIVRDQKIEDPLKEMKEALDSGHNIIIFPEGTRGEPGQIGKFKTGIGRLAVEYRSVPIIPVFLSGPEKAFPRKSALPLPIWNNVTVGPPQMFEGDSLDITSSLEKMIRELSESETAKRHRRHKRPRPAFAYAVLGIDGSGKSTLSRMISKKLSDALRVCLVSDNLEFYESENQKELQPLLTEKVREALGRYAKKAKSLKHYRIPKLAELLLRDHIMGEVQRWYLPDIIVQDGCPLLNLAAWAKIYREEYFNAETCSKAIKVLTGRGKEFRKDDPIFTEARELAALKRFKLDHMRLPDAVIFLDVAPSVSIQRIKSRGEQRQVHETEEKLAKLREGYRLVTQVVEKEFNIPTRILDGESEIDKVTASAMEFIKGLSLREPEHE
ncbi:MAG: 1-acyl-sn-glycerol-3-phosphate acyltransferase [Candidatus Aminicenantes bacterium]|nr:MAG: 1-acyl-sn-glycerol-3-phosphate acyltransferase [Candidatus Aminicenantes bacterium]